MGKLLVCSDIHGQHDAWMMGLQKANFSPENGDRLIVIGDIMDRGPQSKECFFYLYDLINKYPEQVVYLRGNHEEMFLKFLQAQDPLEAKLTADLWFRNGGWKTIQSFLDEFNYMDHTYLRLQSTIQEKYPFLAEFLAERPYYHLEEDAIFVHAGLFPNLTLAEQSLNDMIWIREPFWFNYQPLEGDVLDGKYVVFGHTPVFYIPGYKGTGIYMDGCKIGIDGGCATRHELFVLEWPSLKTVIVPVQDPRRWRIHKPEPLALTT